MVGESRLHLQQDGWEVESPWIRLDVIEGCQQARNRVSPKPVQVVVTFHFKGDASYVDVTSQVVIRMERSCI